MIPIIRSWIDRYFHNEEALLLLVLLLLGFLVIWFMGNDIGPVLVAIVIAFLMQGMVSWLNDRGLPHVLSCTLALLVLIGIMIAILVFLVPVIWDQATRLIAELPSMVTQGQQLLLHLPEEYPSFVTEEQITQLIRHISNELGTIGQNILSFSLAKLPVLFFILLYFVMVPLLVFFFLKDSKPMLRWVGSLLPRERPVMSKVWEEMNLQIANYVRGKVIEIVLVAATSYVCFIILGLNYALLLALAVGFSVVIPYIGAVVVTIPVLLIGYFQWGFGYDLLYLSIVYLIIQGIDGNVLVPVLFSEAVKLHPVAIIMAVLVFGGLWGFWGIFFAIPLATLVKAISNAWPSPVFAQASSEPALIENIESEALDSSSDTTS